MKNEFILNNNTLNIIIILLFLICYTLVILEEFTQIKKSKSTIISASIMWIIISISITQDQDINIMKLNIKHVLLEYSELLLFLFVAMIYINSIKTFGILDVIKYKFISKNLSYKQIFWITGLLAFFISPIADNLTTALLMCAIILSIEKNDKNFINLTCINIVTASNAGGAFSPFGDITTLMIWQNNILSFKLFFYIFIPSLISFLIPAIILSTQISNKKPNIKNKKIKILNNGSKIILLLFLTTILITIILQTYLHLPSTIGMMLGLGLLYTFEYIYNKKHKNNFKITTEISKIEWETLLFFYGIMLCIGAISSLGILNNISQNIYYNTSLYANTIHQQTPANIMIGLLSSLIDNIPITFAVLNMNPIMSEGQWLLVTLTAGIGGSLLSIGSAAGIALMGQTNNIYTFFSHLKWSWAILIGYTAGIATHIYLNKNLFFIN